MRKRSKMKKQGKCMKKIILSLVLAVSATLSIQAQASLNYPIVIYKTNGDSIESILGGGITRVKPDSNGKPVWMFDCNDDDARLEMDDVAEIILRTEAEYTPRLRKALIDFYQAMGGSNWKYNKNWCTDKPLKEWDEHTLSWVSEDDTEFVLSGIQVENAQGSIPECILKMGPLGAVSIDGNVTGELPEWLGKNPSMGLIQIGDSKGIGGLTGDIPEKLWPMDLYLEHNKFTGTLPADLLVYKMDRSYDGSTFEVRLNYNDYSGKIPEAVLNHPRLSEFWYRFVLQKGHLDLTDLWGKISAPSVSFKDINNQTIDLGDIYSKHKYTLLYLGRYGDVWSTQLNRLLIPLYNAYKNLDASNLEVVELNMQSDPMLSDEMIPQVVEIQNIPWINVRWDVWTDWEVLKDHLMSPLVYSMYYNDDDDFYMPNLFLVDQQGKIVWTSMVDNTGQRQHSLTYNANIFSVLEDKIGKVDYGVYQSTDFFMDGDYAILQSASIGNGYDIVFMGDGFVDKDMGYGGVYEKRMNEAMENFFAIEPFRSLRNRFNVYMVKAVSKYEGNFDEDTHAIDTDDDKAFGYVSKVKELRPGRPKRAIVINKNTANVNSFCSLHVSDSSWVAYMKDGGMDAGSICHEAGGHGVGLLFDEYIGYGNHGTTLSAQDKVALDIEWTKFGRGANVDYHADPAEVKWAKFINDPRYAAEELGAYEGCFLVEHGAYRPTVNSVMNDYVFKAFNAPSREAIYKSVMSESLGKDWTYDYETFVSFDEAGRAEYANCMNKNATRALTRGTHNVKTK